MTREIIGVVKADSNDKKNVFSVGLRLRMPTSKKRPIEAYNELYDLLESFGITIDDDFDSELYDEAGNQLVNGDEIEYIYRE